MCTCPHCGKRTFVGGNICDHCAKQFTIASLEDLSMTFTDTVELGRRLVRIDDDSTYVVFLIERCGERSIAMHQFRRKDAGWSYWTAFVYPAGVAREIASAIVEVTC